MRKTLQTTDILPKYLYMRLNNGYADVFITKLIEETEEGLLYEGNEFRTCHLKESDIAANPYKYLDYEEREKTQDEIITELQDINDLLIEQMSENLYELCLLQLGIDLESEEY